MRSIQIGTRTVVATDVLRSYWHVAAERQRVYHRRLSGVPAPWTSDLTLSSYRFTNAYRAADRVSQDLIRIQYSGSRDAEDLLLRTLLYRFFNKPATWRVIEDAVGVVSTETFDPAAIDRELERVLARGQRVYSAAYIIPPPPFGARRKHLNHLRLAEHILACGAAERIREAPTLQQVYAILSSFPSLGPFLAFQLTIDLNYTTLVDFDENEFVVAGPGARSGIAKCFADTGGLDPESLIRWAVEHQSEEFERYELDFQDLFGRPLALIDCQNLFCETDKYARVAHPDATGIGSRTRIKQRFTPQAPAPSPFFPPKWGINDRAVTALTHRRQAPSDDLFSGVLDLNGLERAAG
ncbi:nucleotide kinase domain-containing protein [uncultured Cellulomonas sp.]|uniref:nucleotide kinase domain-containing protein n=1 Tax=uncultured Cellulomonas sp. TaxID=189682 RepID=UPI00260E9BC3|nr:nucleotide kinase domain-containing protein [uncultured Cellulomonas sp.]